MTIVIIEEIIVIKYVQHFMQYSCLNVKQTRRRYEGIISVNFDRVDHLLI